jgi:hypothetical protein
VFNFASSLDDDDCFQITIDHPGFGTKSTHLVSLVILHGPGGLEKKITKADLASSVGPKTLRERLSQLH